MYLDIVERLAKSMASQINSVEDYEKAMDNLDNLQKNDKDFALSLKYYIRENVDMSIAMAYESEVADKYIDKLIQENIDNEIEKDIEKEKKEKREHIVLSIRNLFKRGK